MGRGRSLRPSRPRARRPWSRKTTSPMTRCALRARGHGNRDVIQTTTPRESLRRSAHAQLLPPPFPRPRGLAPQKTTEAARWRSPGGSGLLRLARFGYLLSPSPARGFPAAVRGSGRPERPRSGSALRGRGLSWVVGPLGREEAGPRPGPGRVGAGGAALPWRDGVFGIAAGSGLCLPRLFSVGRRSASAGGGRVCGVLSGFAYWEPGREFFVTRWCVSGKARGCSFSGRPGMPTLSEVEASLKNA